MLPIDRLCLFARSTLLSAGVWILTPLLCLGAGALPAHGQITTSFAGPGNLLGNGAPLSLDINNGGDLFVLNDLEVGDTLYIDRQMFMERRSGGASDGDQSIFFYDDGSANNEAFLWDDSVDSFSLTDDLRIDNTLRSVGDLLVQSTDLFHIYDGRDPDGAGGPFFHWRGIDSFGNIDTLMVLDGPLGALTLDGALFQNAALDLAESFWMSEPLEAGDVVVLDPQRPGAVRKARGVGDPGILGVVSTAPGVVLGGAGFTVADLEGTWGPEVARSFRAKRQLWTERALAANPALRTRLDEAATPEAFAASHQEKRRAYQPRVASGRGDGPAAEPERDSLAGAAGDSPRPAPAIDTARELASRFQETRHLLEAHLERQALAEFFRRHFVPVALAGRIPVKVDARYGAIRPGDPLTASPTPGVAMKATGPGPILGTALAGLEEGRGDVLMFVSRGWHGGPATEPPSRFTPQSSPASLDSAGADDGGTDGTGASGSSLRAFLPSSPPPTTLRSASPGLAEYHPVSEAVSPGEVVVAHRRMPGALEAGRSVADPAVVGIVSGQPGVVLGERLLAVTEALPELGLALEAARVTGDGAEGARLWRQLREQFTAVHAPVALAGTVRAKADARPGAIRVGDLLVTAATRGHLQADADPTPGTVVAKALEPLDDGTGTIRVLVMLR